MTNTNQIPRITLIKAGAGAGKTHKIQETLSGWIQQGKVRADRILAVTFTKAAANEMRQRIRLALIKEGQFEQATLLQQSVINTIHAFGLDILQRFSFEIGASPAPQQLTEDEQKQALSEVLSELESVVKLVNQSERFGYAGGFSRDGYIAQYDEIREAILRVINTLRSVGKGIKPLSELATVTHKSQQALRDIYEKTGDEQSLNHALADAVRRVRVKYPDQQELEKLWGRNADTRKFVDTIFKIDLNNITANWTHWKNLQTVKSAQGIYGTKNNPKAEEDIVLAENIWIAADKLSIHPGPLNSALEHIELLLASALKAMGQYQQHKRIAGLVDYADMVELAYTILERSDWLEELAQDFDCLIIDEFQDTNPLQFALLSRLHQKGVPVFIVGDFKQSIMGFQGADSRLFTGLLQQYENTTGVVQELTSNWRSSQKLMQFLNAVGHQLFLNEYQELTAEVKVESDLTPVRILEFDRQQWLAQRNERSDRPSYSEEGFQLLTNEIVILLNAGTHVTDKHTGSKRPIRAADIAVLAKSNNMLERFAGTLRESGIAVQIQKTGFLECPAVVLLLDALQALNDPNDSFACASLVTSPLLVESPVAELKIMLESALDHAKESKPGFEHRLIKKLSACCEGLVDKPVSDQLFEVTHNLGLLERVKCFQDFSQYRANILKLQSLAQQFEGQSALTLKTLGVVGKNAASFQAWLEKTKTTIDVQPTANPIADDAIVLSTWHGSKGLEWPVVMVLQAEDEPDVRLPSVAIEYSELVNSDAEEFLDNSCIQLLPDFIDKNTQQRMRDARNKDLLVTASNLYYVVLTRAREQLIIPVQKNAKNDTQEESLYKSILPVINKLSEEDAHDVLSIQEMSASKGGVRPLAIAKVMPLRSIVLEKEKHAKVKLLPHTLTPSTVTQEQAVTPYATEYSYQPGFDLDSINCKGTAGELGTWMHRIYQVYLLQPKLLTSALKMKPCKVDDKTIEQSLVSHLDGFLAALENQVGGIKNLQCEVPVIGLNEHGQVVSGVIDLLVEGANGWWIIDHKTDNEMTSKDYWEQLGAYQGLLKNTLKVVGCVLHWTRHGKVSIVNF